MSGTEVRCVLCGKEITRPLDAYRRVSGFVRKRGSGGANSIRLRRVTDEYACVICVDLEANKLNAGQGGLF